MPRRALHNGKEKNPPRATRREHIGPEIKRSLGVILIFILAILLFLSNFGLAGNFGFYVNRALGLVFGQARLLVPILLIILGAVIEFQHDYPHDARHFLGFVLLLAGANGLIQLIKMPMLLSYIMARQGYGGGMLGFASSYPLQYLFGFPATVIILIGIILAAILLLFNTSLAALLQHQKNLFIKLGTLGKIVVGVISLFIKKTPPIYSAYEPRVYGNEEDGGSPSFQAQALKKDQAIQTERASEAAPEQREPRVVPPEDAMTAAVLSRKTDQRLPPLDLLTSVKSSPSAGDIKANMFTIQKTFQNFGISVEMGDVRVGPTVAQYSLRPADGVKLSRITSLSNDLALALAAHPIRIEAPIPGKSLVGIEVPNQKVALVTLREILETKEVQQSHHILNFVLGKDVAGHPWSADLSALPHLLIAGATGSGKTICLNTLILSLLFSHTSETLRFILVDPKRVELPSYNGIPHLLTPVVTDIQKTVNALKWTIGEMERRFEVLSKSGQRNIGAYNRIMEQKMPYIVFVVDELADLMVSAGAEVEAGIIRLAQMARAVGIHLVLATQRPSVDIITGLIKANFPARIAFSVVSLMDSRTILDTSGAEKLLGRGDMLWSPPDLSRPKRLQGAYISEEEIRKVVGFLKSEEAPQYNEDVVSKREQSIIAFKDVSADDDPLLGEAQEVVTQAGKASASLLQRRMKIGYARAARILDLLEARGIIGPPDGAKPRDILIKGRESVILGEDVDKSVSQVPVEEEGEEEESEEELISF